MEVSILLIDDDEVDVKAVRRAFSKFGVATPLKVASDGRQALTLMEGSDAQPPLQRPYFVLLDLNLPKMGGLELLAALRRHPTLRETVVFMMSTSAEPSDIRRAYQLGAAGYLLKSSLGIDFRRLADLIKSYVEVSQLLSA